ncbi:GDP-mannose transporter [Pseudoscourfieldia marina]
MTTEISINSIGTVRENSLKECTGKQASTTANAKYGRVWYVGGIIVAYAACNSQMLIINKLCLTHIPVPNFVLFCQLSFNAVAIFALSTLKIVASDKLELDKVRRFSPVVILFIGTLFSNLKAIQRVPVDTFICVRSSTPIAVALLEYLFLGRAFPSARSCVGLVLILFGVILYVKGDVWFDSIGYLWLITWYVLAVVEMIWVKHIINTVPMTMFGRCYYQNALSIPFTLVLGVLFGETKRIREQAWDAYAIIWLAASCVAAVGISYMSFLLRDVVSATSFSVIGNVCKIATIAVNYAIWNVHATVYGISSLLLSLFGCAVYQQAPLR